MLTLFEPTQIPGLTGDRIAAAGHCANSRRFVQMLSGAAKDENRRCLEKKTPGFSRSALAGLRG